MILTKKYEVKDIDLFVLEYYKNFIKTKTEESEKYIYSIIIKLKVFRDYSKLDKGELITIVWILMNITKTVIEEERSEVMKSDSFIDFVNRLNDIVDDFKLNNK